MVDNKIKSNPAGKGDKIDIDVISLVQIVEKEQENVKKTPIKTVVTNSAKVIGILSTDLDLGVAIKAEDTTPQNDKRNAKDVR